MDKYTKSSILLVAFLCFLLPLWGQSTNITLNKTINGNQLYEATQKITLMPGFLYQNTNGAKFTARIVSPNGQSYQFTETTENTTLPVNTAYPVGTIPGNWSVSPTGAASYTIPIQIAPGIRDIVPNLFINYNHQSGEGLLGLGWSLSGLSYISRVATNLYHETYIDGVDFDASDRFALDGNRLIVSNGGTYGANNTEYRSEIESFVRVTSYGTSGNGPTWFKVETKDGKILEYGNTANSRVEAQGRSDVLVWNVNKVSDKNGAYMTISYTENNSTGECYPLQIQYSGFAAMAPFNTIDFEYQTRSVPFITYVNGSQVKLNSLLSNLYIKNEGVTVGRYQFIYNTTTSRLSEIVYYGKNSTRLNPTYVNWGTENSGISESTSMYDPQISGRYYGDFNGDGKTDFSIVKSNTLYFYQSTGSSFSLSSSKTLPTNFNKILTGDYDGNGKEDFLIMTLASGEYNVKIWESDGSGFIEKDLGWGITQSAVSDFYVADFDGDMKSDILIKLSNSYAQIWKLDKSGSSYIPSAISSNLINWGNKSYCEIKEVPLDVNGNGKSDLMSLATDGCKFYEFENGSLNLISSTSYPTINNVNLFGDFNGDGKTDIFSFDTNNTWKISISTGTGFVVQNNTVFSSFNPYVWYNQYFAP
jgi:hypothetical protein